MKGIYIQLLIVLSLLCFSISGQSLKGRVVNSDGKTPIPFAFIYSDLSNQAVSSDVDGYFSLPLKGNEKTIHVRMLGYEKKSFAIEEINTKENLLVKLKEDGIGLAEIVVKPGEDPAIGIIRKVLKNKPKYDIDNLPYYSCTSYAKTYFTLSDKEGNEDFYKDRKETSLSKTLDRAYLFFVESVSEKKYNYKNVHQEKILASKVSGFSKAPFGAFATQLQSFTFYKDNIELLGIKYLSPLTNGTFKRYRFEIKDTLITENDSILLIQFSPKKNVSFRGMKGILFISKKYFVLSKVLAEPAVIEKNGTGIKIQQLYQQIDSIHWFPSQVNTELIMASMSSSEQDAKKSPVVKGVSKVYVKDVNLDSSFRIRDRSVEIVSEETAYDRDDAYWQKHRKDSLNKKETETYVMVDSIGKKEKFEKKLKWLTALANGKYPLGYFDLDLKHLLRYNQYEALRVGMGISTSDKITRWAAVGAYAAYGFRDKGIKYGGYARVNFDRGKNNYLIGEAISDVEESAGTFFIGESNSFISTQKLRELLIEKMDRSNYVKADLHLCPVKPLQTDLYLKVEERISPFGFYQDTLPAITKFKLNTAGIQLRFCPGEKFIESLGQLVSKGSKWPVLYVNASVGLKEQIDVQKGAFAYNKIDLRIDHQVNFKVKGFFAWQLQAGKVIGDVPYSLQYNNKGSRVRELSLSVEKTFETMFLNEFISTEYASAFVALNFGKMRALDKKFNPELELVHNYGIGNLFGREKLSNIELNDLSKGYSEAGLRIKNLYRSNFSTFGLGVFYRYGNYAFDEFKHNLVVKLALGYSL